MLALFVDAFSMILTSTFRACFGIDVSMKTGAGRYCGGCIKGLRKLCQLAKEKRRKQVTIPQTTAA